jgi:hypothetical protein
VCGLLAARCPPPPAHITARAKEAPATAGARPPTTSNLNLAQTSAAIIAQLTGPAGLYLIDSGGWRRAHLDAAERIRRAPPAGPISLG